MLSFIALIAVSFAGDFFQLREDAEWRRRALKDYEEQTALQAKENLKYFLEKQAAEREFQAAKANLEEDIADIEKFQKELKAEDRAQEERFARREETLQRDQRDSYLAASHEAEFPENQKYFGKASRARKFKAKAKKAKAAEDKEAFRIEQAEKRSRKHISKVVAAEATEEPEAENEQQVSAANSKDEQKKKAHEEKWANRVKNAKKNREIEEQKAQKKREMEQKPQNNQSDENETSSNSTELPESSVSSNLNLQRDRADNFAPSTKKGIFLECFEGVCFDFVAKRFWWDK